MNWVELVIAVSVVLAGLNVLFPIWHHKRWLIAFLFGLIHGFGFAGALRELSLTPEGLFASMISFNLGVELGQIAIVALVLPLIFMLRGGPSYQYRAMPAGAILIVAAGLVWSVDRVGAL